MGTGAPKTGDADGDDEVDDETASVDFRGGRAGVRGEGDGEAEDEFAVNMTFKV